jgi:DNA replication and repair protein RecF
VSIAGPRLTRLTLTGFRNHAQSDLRFDGQLIAFAGPNGAGKTNILEAISLLSPGRGLRRATYGEMAGSGGTGGFAVSAALVPMDHDPAMIRSPLAPGFPVRWRQAARCGSTRCR